MPRRLSPPANDNRPKRDGRRIQVLGMTELPITELELEILETYLPAIIARMAAKEPVAANDNAPDGAE